MPLSFHRDQRAVRHPCPYHLAEGRAAGELGISETNVHRHLRVLTEAGVLVPTNHHKGHRILWRAPDVLAVLDAYAHDVGRRA